MTHPLAKVGTTYILKGRTLNSISRISVDDVGNPIIRSEEIEINVLAKEVVNPIIKADFGIDSKISLLECYIVKSPTGFEFSALDNNLIREIDNAQIIIISRTQDYLKPLQKIFGLKFLAKVILVS